MSSRGDRPGPLRIDDRRTGELARRFAVNSQTMPSASLLEFVDAASAAGFRNVECAAEVLDDAGSSAVQVLLDSGLSVAGVCPSASILDWHWGWNGRLERTLESELGRAAALGAGYFVLPFMRPRGDRSSVELALARAVPMARAAGLRLAIEPIGHFDVLRRAEELSPVLRNQDGDVVSLLLDSFHFFRAGHSIDDLELYADIPVAGIQLSNVNHRPTHEALGYRDRTFPGDGRWPLAEFTSMSAALFPDAPLIVEVIGEVAASTPTTLGAARAYEQLIMLTDHIAQEA